jgi:hypothetical protein
MIIRSCAPPPMSIEDQKRVSAAVPVPGETTATPL